MRREEEREDCTRRLSCDYSGAAVFANNICADGCDFYCTFYRAVELVPPSSKNRGWKLLEMTEFHRCLFLASSLFFLPSSNGGWSPSFGMTSEPRVLREGVPRRTGGSSECENISVIDSENAPDKTVGAVLIGLRHSVCNL